VSGKQLDMGLPCVCPNMNDSWRPSATPVQQTQAVYSQASRLMLVVACATKAWWVADWSSVLFLRV
jgi:hypothetical protein